MTIDANMRPSDAVVYDLEIPDVLEVLRTTENGLPSDEARQRFLAHGPNELQALARTSPWHTLASQFKNVLVLILLVATVLSRLLGRGLNAVVIAMVVLFAVLLGFVQEYRAVRALESLREMAAPLPLLHCLSV